MAENKHKTELKGKDKFLTGLSIFLVKNKVLLRILLAAAAVIIITVAVMDSISERKANISAESVEVIQEKYTQWLSAEEADKAALETEIIGEAERIAEEYGSTFAAQRAIYIKGSLSFQNEDWDSASEIFLEAAALNSDSYLAPIALMLAALSNENAGKYSDALLIYTDIFAQYDKIFPDIPRVMLSIGRLNEQIDDSGAAIDAYNMLIDKYPGSGWASFARTRIIQMGS
ncbi:MAG: tetratricopeptide repeat protein [Spirochaetales bacterium]|nr:tetratricopeptide repeat protein [Spirochaetales bacterium]